MSQDQLHQQMSNLSLDQQPQQPTKTSRRHKRPTRAYHDVNSGSFSNGLQAQGNEQQFVNQFQPNMNTSTPQFNNVAQFGGAGPLQDQTFSPQQVNPSMSVTGIQNGNMQNHMAGGNQFEANAMPANAGDAVGTSSHYVPTQRWEDQINYLTKTFQTMNDSVPPLPTTSFYSVDQGSCNPKTMSLSMLNIPENEQLRHATKLPLGMTIQPFSDLVTLNGTDIPTISSIDGENKVKAPIRCHRCRSYINPGYKLSYDSTFSCNICKVKSKMPMDILPGLNNGGNATSLEGRPEMSNGTVDFLAPSEYNAIQGKESLPLHYIFVIDVTSMAIGNGSVLAVIEAIRQSIEYIIDNQPKCKVAIMTFDNKLKFYNLRPELDAAQEYIVAELSDVFIPFYNGLFADPAESINVITDTLRKIENFVRTDIGGPVPNNCYGSAIEAAKLALSEITGNQGGKIICSLNSLPTVGNGNLRVRRDDNLKQNLQCDNDFYRKLSDDLLRSYISVDLFVTSDAFVDMLTVGTPVEMTAGTLKYYPKFQKEMDDHLIINDMIENVSNIVGYQALLKVRCSTGLTVDQYYLKSVDYSDRDPMFPILTKNTVLDVLLKYTDKLKAKEDAYFQTAILYTDINGVRKVRSINCTGAVSNNMPEVFKFMNQNALMRIMIKDVIRTLGNCDYIGIRKTIEQKVAEILTQYTALGRRNPNSLVLPDAIKTLPMYLLSFEKSDLMKPNAHSTRGNDRVYDLFTYGMLNSSRLSYKLYPQFIPLHALLEENDLTFYDSNNKMLQIESQSVDELSVRNGFNQLLNGGCYLICNGEKVYLMFNKNTNRMLLQDLIGADPTIALNDITLYGGILPEMDSQINEKARNAIQYWCEVCNKQSLPIVLLRPEVDNYYQEVMGKILCEDETINKIPSYEKYLIQLHATIQEKVKKEDYIKVAGNSKSHELFHQQYVQF
ncbi:similar to Saccharomyces cerevisiae YHR098C SFB3 Component of the Sec23p-Sfb3p heterodimer of the COPII vesicle coat [Maudiozyma saulgeensis]|uniref:Similar to Saccharomyces cerevisiae YHR098C SFB3 Component of the Sec23p-Sfb3p heterodimer of the COPII vesicle coat n=1 Tax=Maudiozyma saulgeensis TaxID=1789683 RepID=A0A1X7QY33_9SACH|nr:similar to Saccharomyces cerevisiae YHR098C SFB3 Component of the Sec23p-Sfb3p heterodimer of the COPII vesicle coat [Kazachstania saulgeensis]